MAAEVMVVDDDPSIGFTVKTVLSRAGHSVRVASSGAKALEELHSGFRGVIFMDIMMPGMDGWDTIQAIVNDGLLRGNVICMLTAVGAPGPKMDALKEYVIDYIRKPFGRDALLAAVDNYSEMLSGSAY